MTMNDQIILSLEETLKALAKKRATLVAHGEELSVRRKALSFAANTGDAKAKKQLDALSAEAATHHIEIENLDAAIEEGKVRLDAARIEANNAQKRRNAELIRDNLLVAFKDNGTRLDQIMAELHEQASRQQEILHRIRTLGCEAPTGTSVKINSGNAVSAVISQTIWNNAAAPLRASERQTFGKLYATWESQILNYCNAILNPKQEVA
jgi:hypothetical protein